MQRALLLTLALLIPATVRAQERLSKPLAASLEQVVSAPRDAWRSRSVEVFRWDLFPDILILDTADYQVQGRYFSRLAYFLEKRGFRGRLLTNGELAGRHGWNAHDYGAPGLAEFFNAASAKGFGLNPEERMLEELALREGILVADGERVAPGAGGVLGVSLSTSITERRYLLAHESFHGVFFSSASYRELCFQLWDTLPPEERSFYLRFLDSLGYDAAVRSLAVNEFQAYLMQQPLTSTLSYFRRFVTRFAADTTDADMVAAGLRKAAGELDAWLRNACGFGAGGPLFEFFKER